jgi:acetyltransferase-like isoleucine patch superfamily enzyme
LIAVESGYLGAGSTIEDGVVIRGRRVEIGRHAQICRGAHIGGGSCMDWQSRLHCGDFLFLGEGAHLNQGYGVEIGDEVGLGFGTRIFTHGGYPNPLRHMSSGLSTPSFADVSIGDRCWLPNAIVLPGVRLGADVIVSAASLVNRSFEEASLIGGIPAKLLKPLRPSRSLDARARGQDVSALLIRVMEQCARNATARNIDLEWGLDPNGLGVWYCGTGDRDKQLVDPIAGTLRVVECPQTELVLAQFRRTGIRFSYAPESPCVEGSPYAPWTSPDQYEYFRAS